MILYNSLGQTKQEFIPHTAGKVNMYTCGPTVTTLPTSATLELILWKMCLKSTFVLRDMMLSVL